MVLVFSKAKNRYQLRRLSASFVIYTLTHTPVCQWKERLFRSLIAWRYEASVNVIFGAPYSSTRPPTASNSIVAFKCLWGRGLC